MRKVKEEHEKKEMIKMGKQSTVKKYLKSMIAVLLVVIMAIPSEVAHAAKGGYVDGASDAIPSSSNNRGSGSSGVSGITVRLQGGYKVSVTYTSKGLFNGNNTGALSTDGTKGIYNNSIDPKLKALFEKTSHGAVPLYSRKTPIGLTYGSTEYLPKSIKAFKSNYNIDLKENLNKFSSDVLKNVGSFGIGAIYFTDTEESPNFEYGVSVDANGDLVYRKGTITNKKITTKTQVKKAAQRAYKDWVNNYGADAGVTSRTNMDSYLNKFFSLGAKKLSDGKTVKISSVSKVTSLYDAVLNSFTVPNQNLNGSKPSFDMNSLMESLSGKSDEAKKFFSARNVLVTMTMLNLMKDCYKTKSGVGSALSTWYRDYAAKTNEYELAFVVEPLAFLSNTSADSKGASITPNSYLAGWLTSNEKLESFPSLNANINAFINKSGYVTTYPSSNPTRAIPKNITKTLLYKLDKGFKYTFMSGYNSSIIGSIVENSGKYVSGKYTDNFGTNSGKNRKIDFQTLKNGTYYLAVGDVTKDLSITSGKFSSPITQGNRSLARATISKLAYTGYTSKSGKPILIRSDNGKDAKYSYARLGWGMLHTADYINPSNPGTSAEMYTSTISLVAKDTKTVGEEYLGNTSDTGYADKTKEELDKLGSAMGVLIPVMKSVYNNTDGDYTEKYNNIVNFLVDLDKDGCLDDNWSSVLKDESMKSINEYKDTETIKDLAILVTLAECKFKGVEIPDESLRNKVEDTNISALTITRMLNGNTITQQSEVLRVLKNISSTIGSYDLMGKLLTKDSSLPVKNNIRDDVVNISGSEYVNNDAQIYITNRANLIQSGYLENGDTILSVREGLSSVVKNLELQKELTTEEMQSLAVQLNGDKTSKIYVNNKKGSKSNGFVKGKNNIIIRNTVSNAGNNSLTMLLSKYGKKLKVDSDSMGSISLVDATKASSDSNTDNTNANKFSMSPMLMASTNVTFKQDYAYTSILRIKRDNAEKDKPTKENSLSALSSDAVKISTTKKVVSNNSKYQFKKAITDRKGGISAEIGELQELMADYINDCSDFYTWYSNNKEDFSEEKFKSRCETELQIRLANYLDIVLDRRNVDKETALSERLTTYVDAEDKSKLDTAAMSKSIANWVHPSTYSLEKNGYVGGCLGLEDLKVDDIMKSIKNNYNSSSKYGRTSEDISIGLQEGSTTSVLSLKDKCVIDEPSVIKYNYTDSTMKYFGVWSDDVKYINAGIPINKLVMDTGKKVAMTYNLGAGTSYTNVGKISNLPKAYIKANEKSDKLVDVVGNKELSKYKVYDDFESIKGINYYYNKINNTTNDKSKSFLNANAYNKKNMIADKVKVTAYINSLFGENSMLSSFVGLSKNNADYNPKETVEVKTELMQDIILKSVCIASLTKSESSVLVDCNDSNNDTEYMSYIPASSCVILSYTTNEAKTENSLNACLSSDTDGTIDRSDLEYVNAAQLSSSLVKEDSNITGMIEYTDVAGNTQQLISGSRIWNSSVYGGNTTIANLDISITDNSAPQDSSSMKQWLVSKQAEAKNSGKSLIEYLIENGSAKIIYTQDAYTLPVGVTDNVEKIINDESTSVDNLLALSIIPFNKDGYTINSNEESTNTFVGKDALNKMLDTYTLLNEGGSSSITYEFNGNTATNIKSTVIDCKSVKTKVSACVSAFEAKNRQVPTIVTIKVGKSPADRVNVFLEKPSGGESKKYKVGDAQPDNVIVSSSGDKDTSNGTTFKTKVENKVDGPSYTRLELTDDKGEEKLETVTETKYKLVYSGIVDGTHGNVSKQEWANSIKNDTKTLVNKTTYENTKKSSNNWISDTASNSSKENGYEEDISIRKSEFDTPYGDTIVCIYVPLDDDKLTTEDEVKGDFTLYDDEVSRMYKDSMILSWGNIKMDLYPKNFTWNYDTDSNNENSDLNNGEDTKEKNENWGGSKRYKDFYNDKQHQYPKQEKTWSPKDDHKHKFTYKANGRLKWVVENTIQEKNANNVYSLVNKEFSRDIDLAQDEDLQNSGVTNTTTDKGGVAELNKNNKYKYSLYVSRMGKSVDKNTDNLNVPSYKYNNNGVNISGSNITIKPKYIRTSKDNQKKVDYTVDLKYTIKDAKSAKLKTKFSLTEKCLGYWDIGDQCGIAGHNHSDGCTHYIDTKSGREWCNAGYVLSKVKNCKDNTKTNVKGAIGKALNTIGVLGIEDKESNAKVRGTQDYNGNKSKGLIDSLKLYVNVFEAKSSLDADVESSTGSFEAIDGTTIENVDSTVLKYKDGIKFYPYVRMQTSANGGAKEKYYAILGDYKREIPRLDTIEIGWSKIEGTAKKVEPDKNSTGYDSTHNLQITSKQWSTHARSLSAFNDESMKNKVLPGGAVYQLSTGVLSKDASGNKVKQDNSKQSVKVGVRTFNYFIPTDKFTKVNSDNLGMSTSSYNRNNVMKELESAFKDGKTSSNLDSYWNKYKSSLTLDSAKSSASKTIKGILRGLSQTEIQQVVAKGRLTEDELLDNVLDKSKYKKLYSTSNEIRAIALDSTYRKVFNRNLSDLSKYWLKKSIEYKDNNKTISRDTADSSSLDVTNLKQRKSVYTVRSAVNGNVIVEKYNVDGTYIGKLTLDKGTNDIDSGEVVLSSSNTAKNKKEFKSAIKSIDGSCKLISNYIASIQRDSGNGHKYKANGEEKNTTGWYNESFDGISVLVSEYVMELGFYNGNDGIETTLGNIASNGNSKALRSAALNVGLVGKQENKSDLYNFSEDTLEDKVRTSIFVMKPFIGSDINKYEEIASIGKNGTISFNNWSDLIDSDGTALPIKLKDMATVYHSRTFYIPNATVMDLN